MYIDNSIDDQILNKKFENIEEHVKKKVREINERDPFCSIVPTVVDDVFALTKEIFDNVNLFSIAFLVDDIFIITFPTSEDYSIWNTHSFFNEGSIGRQCRKALKTKEKVTVYKNKIEVFRQDALTQKKIFLSKKCNIESHFVSPMIIHETIIGRIQLSFKQEVGDEQKQQVEDYLIWINNKIIWIIYSEFVRVNNIMHNLKSTVEILLGDIDEYQAKHSQNVSLLAKTLATIIVKDRDSNYEFSYKGILDENLVGVDILKLQVAGLLHDIGKVRMWSFDKFNTELEQRKRDLHPYFSYSIINKMRFSEDIADIAGFHHECMNGKGAPFAIEGESMNIVTQIIRCVDIIDSCLRKRPSSGSDKPSRIDNDTINLEDAMQALIGYENKISYNVYATVIAILDDIKEKKIEDKYGIRQLLKIDNETSKQLTISAHSDIDNFLNKCLNNLDWNKWIVVFVFQCKNINQYSYTKDDNGNRTLSFENQKLNNINSRYKSDFSTPFVSLQNNIYLGIYNEEENKEYAYSFCESLDKHLSIENNLACAFLSHNIIYMDDFQEILNKCIDKLKNACFDMNNNSRWRLLRFDINKKEWK